MTEDELKDLIVNKIRQSGIDFRAVSHLDSVAVINPTKKCGAYDVNEATPFNLAHEFFHAKLKHRRRRYDYDVSNAQEHEANVAAVNYLWRLFIMFGGTVEYANVFIKTSGAPMYLLERMLKAVY